MYTKSFNKYTVAYVQQWLFKDTMSLHDAAIIKVAATGTNRGKRWALKKTLKQQYHLYDESVII